MSSTSRDELLSKLARQTAVLDELAAAAENAVSNEADLHNRYVQAQANYAGYRGGDRETAFSFGCDLTRTENAWFECLSEIVRAKEDLPAAIQAAQEAAREVVQALNTTGNADFRLKAQRLIVHASAAMGNSHIRLRQVSFVKRLPRFEQLVADRYARAEQYVCGTDFTIVKPW